MMTSDLADMSTLNFNVGVLGHVDSGKTSLAKSLSTVASTAAFDKNPQSRERGITLDLGFSSFLVPPPSHLTSSSLNEVQITLVDCPGHASLIRTIIGGAQIIDMMMLVVDCMKGMQTQTAECLVIGEITCAHLIVALNKVDLLPESTRDSQLEKITKRLSRTLEQTRYTGAPIVPISARPGGADSATSPFGLDNLIKVLVDRLFLPARAKDGPFLFSVDHCFGIRGQGTVLTGTVLSGSVAVNETVEIPILKISKKIKSMQMFRKPVQHASQGDRVGICVTQFDPTLVERCLIASQGYLHTFYAAVIEVYKIPYHKCECKTGGKFHVTIGHETTMAKTTFFCSDENLGNLQDGFLFHREFVYQDCLLEFHPVHNQPLSKPWDTSSRETLFRQFALLEFEKPIICPTQSKVIGSRLDSDALSNTCRIAFHGSLVECITHKDYETSVLPKIRIFKPKTKEGLVDRIHDERTIIGKSIFKKETKIELFVSMRVQLSTGENGIIEGSFGTNGKFRVNFPDGLLPNTVAMLNASKKKQKGGACADGEQSHAAIKIILNFKRYIFDPFKRMAQ